MPRKEDGMLFEVHPAPLKDKEGNNYVYVRPYGVQHRTLEEVDSYCARNFAVQPGDVSRVLNVFMEAAKYWLSSGDRIETPFGTFAPKIGLRSEKTTADKVGSTDVELQGIEFTPTREFMRKIVQLNNGFRPVRNPDTLKLKADTPHLELAMQRCISERGYATVRSFMRHSGLTYHSARKQLNLWCEGDSPRLLRTKMGSTFVYTET